MKLNPVKFDYKKGVTNQIGFIAQDVQKIIPEAVDITDKNTGMLGLKTQFITPYLVNAIKELKIEKDMQIALLKSENEKLKAKVENMSTLEERLTRIENMIELSDNMSKLTKK